MKTLKKPKKILACSYALDNDYLYQTLISITSLVENAGKSVFYDIYLLINQEFKKKNKKKILSLGKKYSKCCYISFINMGNKYKFPEIQGRISISTYYRLELPDLLPYVDRIIYMDGDTLVFHDLSELININMKGNYILGFPDSFPNALKKYGIKKAVILCAGVLLMDLKAMRKDNITNKFKDFLSTNLGRISQHDQTIINYICQKKISYFPPRYGIWNFKNKKSCIYHNNNLPEILKYNEKELLKAYLNPYILHYVRRKPFPKAKNKRYYMIKKWWEYAKKSDYYKEIMKFRNIYINTNLKMNESN